MSDIEIELPGMENVERVELPFSRQQPCYRVQWRFHVTGYAHFTTWEDPEGYLDDGDHDDEIQDEVLNSGTSEVECDSGWYADIEVQNEDGIWKKVDQGTYDRIQAHRERQS